MNVQLTEPIIECGICYDTLDASKNNCSTTCGHPFCMNCFIKVTQTNNCCPICRTELYRPKEVEEDEYEVEEDEYEIDEDEYEIDEDEYEIDENEVDYDTDDDYTDEAQAYYLSIEYGVSIDMIVERFEREGISYKDLLTLLYLDNRRSTINMEYRRNLSKKADDLVEEMDTENRERIGMGKEDKNRLEPIQVRHVNILIPRPKKNNL